MALKQYISTEKLNPVGSPGLTPSLLDSGRAGNVINFNAAQVRPKRIVAEQDFAERNTDSVGPTVARVGQVVGRAAAEYYQRSSELEAGKAKLQLQEAYREAWLGKDTDQGFLPGYAATKSEKAAKGFDAFDQAIRGTRLALAEELDDHTKQIFLASSVQLEQQYLNQGAAHSTAGQTDWEKQQAKEKHQAFMVELGDMGINVPGALQKIQQEQAKILATGTLTPAQAEEWTQQTITDLGLYYSTQPQGGDRLGTLLSLTDSYTDLETKTTLNRTLAAVVRTENSLIRDAEIDAERAQTKLRQENDKSWFVASFQNPGLIDTVKGLEMVTSGTLSPSVYMASRDRKETRGNLPPMPAAEEIRLKRQIVMGEIPSEDIISETMAYDDASMRRLGNFAIQAEGYAMRDDLRYGFERIERLVRTFSMGRPAEAKILATHRQYEQLLQDKISPDTALNQVLQPMMGDISNFTPEILQFSNGSVIDMAQAGPDIAIDKVVEMREAEEITPEEADKAAGEINRYKQSIQNSKPKEPETIELPRPLDVSDMDI